jgi:hypothetical protein
MKDDEEEDEHLLRLTDRTGIGTHRELV